eukprot:CAMPEP_0173397450 /NCGR_PEP_ID=MMETSP1356-20130122/38460_1 /TAXON_ID=77927 ORGANISM="Hemiselmis virescens, Strain PCC157" /NCGR_SAMPLE_ID=MMETSP1356 /ASSEMBLY_ACC=CAM_ASM_000847 /LENGTH=96 /DNA_ID=CAMNT_0014356721 /DNA_START=19 /DNA_END=307 /DNA_ORIENTATION=+
MDDAQLVQVCHSPHNIEKTSRDIAQGHVAAAALCEKRLKISLLAELHQHSVGAGDVDDLNKVVARVHLDLLVHLEVNFFRALLSGHRLTTQLLAEV